MRYFLMVVFFLVMNTNTFAMETIVILRHGEKPANGLGQLTCQGLNRALALPSVLMTKFGRPDIIFAPDPHDKIPDGAQYYDYVRPLATIEPTAIQNGEPVNTQFGFAEIEKLATTLRETQYHDAKIFVAWEHLKAYDLVRLLLQKAGASQLFVPAWQDDDYDSLYIVTMNWASGKSVLQFKLDHENLNNMSDVCPVANKR